MRKFLTGLLFLAAAAPALAQEAPQEFPFEGGKLTITETEDSDKVLAFDGKELARDYQLFHYATEQVGASNVAIFLVGPGGNACGANTLVVWKPEGADIRSTKIGADCGSPMPAIASEAIYFVPWVAPGGAEDVVMWSPENGVQTAGRLNFMPNAGTGFGQWKSGDAGYPIDAFRNAAFYEKSRQMLGADFDDVVGSFLFGGPMDRLPSGLIVGEGCVPHACTTRDGFVAIDADKQAIYLAQQQDGREPRTWPALDSWPAEARDAMAKAFAPN